MTSIIIQTQKQPFFHIFKDFHQFLGKCSVFRSRFLIRIHQYQWGYHWVCSFCLSEIPREKSLGLLVVSQYSGKKSIFWYQKFLVPEYRPLLKFMKSKCSHFWQTSHALVFTVSKNEHSTIYFQRVIAILNTQ